MILKKSSVPCALVGSLASGDQLHSDAYGVCVQERLGCDESSSPGVGIIREQPGKKYCARGSFGSVQTTIANIAADVFVVA
jgi:hypothetical protein